MSSDDCSHVTFWLIWRALLNEVDCLEIIYICVYIGLYAQYTYGQLRQLANYLICKPHMLICPHQLVNVAGSGWCDVCIRYSTRPHTYCI